MTEKTVAEQAAELARTLPASSTLSADYGFRHDVAEEDPPTCGLDDLGVPPPVGSPGYGPPPEFED